MGSTARKKKPNPQKDYTHNRFFISRHLDREAEDLGHSKSYQESEPQCQTTKQATQKNKAARKKVRNGCFSAVMRKTKLNKLIMQDYVLLLTT